MDRKLYSRRDALQIGAAGAVAAGLGQRAVAGPDCIVSPSQTEGPYWVDEMLNRSDIRTDPKTGERQAGFPLRFAVNVSEYSVGGCTPVPGCVVDVWHCNALGVYSDVQQQGTVGEAWLRGFQTTDAHGNVRFLSIYPGYYPGRTAHIHFRVRKFDDNGNTTFNFVSQLYFDDDVTDIVYDREPPYNTRPPRTTRNNNDGIFNSALLMRLAENKTHSLASFNVVIDDEEGGLGLRNTPTDDHSMEHLHDFGGGTPPMRIA